MIDFIKNNKAYVINCILNYLCIVIYTADVIINPNSQHSTWIGLLWLSIATLQLHTIHNLRENVKMLENSYKELSDDYMEILSHDEVAKAAGINFEKQYTL